MLLARLQTNCKFKAKMGQPHLLSKPISLDNVLLWAGLKYPQRYGTTLKVTQFQLVGLQRLQGKQCAFWCLAQSPASSELLAETNCTVGGHPLTTVMTLKNAFATASLYYYSKKSSPIKSAESMNFIIKSNFQVLSVFNQFKNDRLIL